MAKKKKSKMDRMVKILAGSIVLVLIGTILVSLIMSFYYNL